MFPNYTTYPHTTWIKSCCPYRIFYGNPLDSCILKRARNVPKPIESIPKSTRSDPISTKNVFSRDPTKTTMT